MYRRKTIIGTENSSLKPAVPRLYDPSAVSVDKLVKPFKCPGAAAPTRERALPARKRRKINYSEGENGKGGKGDEAYADGEAERPPLTNQDINKFPVFEVKDKETVFRQRFAVPLINKPVGGYNSSRPAPALGMRRSANFIPRPLHDPSGEFAIVLYDPTIDGKNPEVEEAKAEEEKVVSKVHKSLADILGLNKKVEEHPEVPVVIDPRLAKVLRPHQVEGVKVVFTLTGTDLGLSANLILVSLPLYDRSN